MILRLFCIFGVASTLFVSAKAHCEERVGLIRDFRKGAVFLTIYASTHSRTDALVFADSRWQRRIDSADFVIFEQPISTTYDEVMTAIARPERNLSAQSIDSSERQAAARGVSLPRAIFEGVRPIVAYYRALGIATRADLSRESRGIEERFRDAVRAQKKRIAYLESIDRFAKAVNLISEIEEQALLSQSIEFVIDPMRRGQLREWGLNSGQMLRDSTCKTFESAYENLFESTTLLANAYSKLHRSRNNDMFTRLEQLLVGFTGSAVVVVGASHVCGEDGLFELLRAAGYSEI
jgi:uncharacterized protein YbaP (TraB family)